MVAVRPIERGDHKLETINQVGLFWDFKAAIKVQWKVGVELIIDRVDRPGAIIGEPTERGDLKLETINQIGILITWKQS